MIEITLGTGTGPLGSSATKNRLLCHGKWVHEILNSKEQSMVDGPLIVGSLFHWFWQHWMDPASIHTVKQYTFAWVNEHFTFKNQSGSVVAQDALAEALRVFCHYLVNNGSKNEFGRIVATELQLNILGYTTAADALVQLNDSDTEVLENRYGLVGLLPGYYGIDNKTSSMRAGNSREIDEVEFQFSYTNALLASHLSNIPQFASKKYRGMLVNHISKTKNPVRWVNFVPYTILDDFRFLTVQNNDAQFISELKENKLILNPAACITTWGPCSLASTCPRHSSYIEQEKVDILLKVLETITPPPRY